MSGSSEQDPIKLAMDAEQDLNSNRLKQGVEKGREGKNAGDSATESGVNDDVTSRFPGSTVTYGSAASGQGDNREIPDEEGGGINPETGRQTKARDFEGVGGPEDQLQARENARPGDQDIQGNVRNDEKARPSKYDQ